MTEILSSWRDQPSSCGECDSFVYDLSGQEETSVDSPPDRETIDPIPTRMAEEDCRTASVQKIITDEQRVREFYTVRIENMVMQDEIMESNRSISCLRLNVHVMLM